MSTLSNKISKLLESDNFEDFRVGQTLLASLPGFKDLVERVNFLPMNDTIVIKSSAIKNRYNIDTVIKYIFFSRSEFPELFEK